MISPIQDIPAMTLGRVETPPEYHVLIKHLLDHEKFALNKRLENISLQNIETLIEELSNDAFMIIKSWTMEELKDLSDVMMAAFKKGKCPHKQVVSFHILSAAIDEMHLNLRARLCYQVISGKNVDKQEFDFRVFSPPGRLWKRFFKKQDKKRLPYLQQFFNLNGREWNRFCDLMESEEPSEQWYHLMRVPRYGCISNILERMKDVFGLFPKIEFWESEDLCEFVMVIPTFSMIQNFLAVKADNNRRPAIKLEPRFGALSLNDVERIKRNGGCQFGLHLPGTSREYMKNVDSWEDCGALSFLFHDLYHALREQEMKPHYSAARFRLVDILPDEAVELKESLIDGELLMSYQRRNRSITHPLANEKFGAIFSTCSLEEHWRDVWKQLILKDMAYNADEWKDKFQIDKSELKAPENDVYETLIKRKHALDLAVERVVKRKITSDPSCEKLKCM